MTYDKNILKPEGKVLEDGGIVYFAEPPKNILPSRDRNPRDKSRWSYWRKSNFEFFKNELARFSDDSTLIDLGAGQSDFLELVSRFKRCAVDFYPYAGIDVVADFSKELPFIDGSVDIILLSNVLEHIQEPNEFLKECARILKNKGVILGSVPFLIAVHQLPYDFYRYTDINLNYIFRKLNFSDIQITPVVNFHALLFNVYAKLFTALIQKTTFSENVFLQKACVFFLRILWKTVRIFLWAFQPIFEKACPDPDMPLGYLFSAKKV